MELFILIKSFLLNIVNFIFIPFDSLINIKLSISVLCSSSIKELKVNL